MGRPRTCILRIELKKKKKLNGSNQKYIEWADDINISEETFQKMGDG